MSLDINLTNVESTTNKSTDVNTDQASNTKYPSVKAVFDWANSAISWIATNGANVLSHLSNNNNPHSTTATQVDALKRDGSNANSDVDLDTFGLDAKFIKIKGTAGNGHLNLKHQSSGATAGGSESVIYADNSGNPKWKNDGNAVQNVMLENSAITGATKTKITYDAKGLVTAGTDATTADIADSSDKRYVTDANLVVIGNTSNTNTGDETQASILSKLGWIRKLQKSGTVTGTTSETLVHTFSFSANEYPASSILHIESQFIRTGTPSANGTIRFKINTSNTIVGSTLIGQASIGGNTNLYSQPRRKFDIEGGLIQGLVPNSSLITDIATSTSTPLSVSLDTTQNWWLFITYQPQNINDIAVVSFTEIKNF